MSRYDLPDGGRAQYEPGSRGQVLRNHLGIVRVREAERRETEMLAEAYADSLEWMDTDTVVTAELICEMHRLWLGRLYPMAGNYREVDLSKDGFPFCHALYIPREMERMNQEQLAACTPCNGTLEEVAEKLAIVHAELLLIHPFREGNGRLSRWLADLMAMQAGFPAPEYDLSGLGGPARKQAYFAALRRGYAGNVTDLSELFASWLRRASRRRPSTRRVS